MTPQQLENRQLETRVTALEAELSQVKKLLSSFPQIETVNPTWMKYAGMFKDDLDFLEVMREIRAEKDSDDESEVDPSYYILNEILLPFYANPFSTPDRKN